MKTLTSLLERLNLDPEVLEACARNAEALGIPLERALYEAERINENQYLETAAARHAMPCELRLAALMDKEGSGWATDAERVCKVPLPWLRKQKVVPVRDKDGKLALAICHPSGWLLAQELGMLLGERLERPVLAREDDITDIINRIFGESTRSEGSVSDVLGDSVNAIDEFNEDAVEDLLEDSSEAPFIRLVNMILAQAVRAGASDIHIEPYRDVSRVRFRLDGVLYERHTLNKAHHAAVVSRIKVMAKLNIAEKRLPQDGRIAISLGGRQAGLRVSTLPRGAPFARKKRASALPHRTRAQPGRPAAHAFPCGDHARHRAGHRPHRQRQDHHALCRASGTDRAGQEHPDHRRSC